MNLTIEKKRNRVFDYCAKTGCKGDCKLKNWKGKSKFLNNVGTNFYGSNPEWYTKH